MLKELASFDEGIIASTNVLKILINSDHFFELLVKDQGKGLNLRYSIKSCEKRDKEKSEDFYKRIDEEIKTLIRSELGLPSTDPVKYSRLIHKKRVLFFYLSDTGVGIEELLRDIEECEFDVHRVIQTIIYLRVKLEYLKDVEQRYNLTPSLHNSELFIGAIDTGKLNDGSSIVQALKVSLFYSYFNEVVLRLKRVVFKCSRENVFIAINPEGSILFHQADSTYKVIEQLDGRRFNDRVWMAYFPSEEQKKKSSAWKFEYINSVNYHTTVALHKTVGVLDSLCVPFEGEVFQPSLLMGDFVSLPMDYQNDLIVIDCYNRYKSKSQRTEFHRVLQNSLGCKAVLSGDNLPSDEQMYSDENTSYLVLNTSTAKDKSSIVSNKEHEYNTFVQALAAKKKDGDEVFDFYTESKIRRFYTQKHNITQGVDLFSLTNTEGKYLNKDGDMIAINKNVLKKIKTELWFKEKVFKERRLSVPGACDGEYTLFYMRKTAEVFKEKAEGEEEEEKEVKIKQEFCSVVEVSICDGQLVINNQKRYECKRSGEFDFTYSYLGCVFPDDCESIWEAMYNQGFYMYDKANQKVLVSFTSIRVPQILGNAKFSNLDRLDNINRKKGDDGYALPFYINRLREGQRHYVFLQKRENNVVDYFVSAHNPAPGKLEKQNLIYRLLVFDLDGNHCDPLEEPLGEMYLRSFTYDMLKSGESSKKSIYRKIADLFIEN